MALHWREIDYGPRTFQFVKCCVAGLQIEFDETLRLVSFSPDVEAGPLDTPGVAHIGRDLRIPGNVIVP